MRNRYLVSLATALMAILLVLATGCKGNPEKAKKKYLESGLSYMDKKQYDAAVIQFKKAIQVDPRFADAHYQLGLTYLRQGHAKEGYSELRKASELDPKNLKARLEQGLPSPGNVHDRRGNGRGNQRRGGRFGRPVFAGPACPDERCFWHAIAHRPRLGYSQSGTEVRRPIRP